MADKQIYDVLLPEEYSDKNGEVKTKFHQIGVAFDARDGGRSVEITPGLSVSGRFVIMPRRDKAEA